MQRNSCNMERCLMQWMQGWEDLILQMIEFALLGTSQQSNDLMRCRAGSTPSRVMPSAAAAGGVNPPRS